MAKILIKNGKVISPTGVVANDVLIDGETISAVGTPGCLKLLKRDAIGSLMPPENM